MPIPGIGKRNFVEIGRIRKGAEKGQGGQMGRDLDYFRVTFREDAGDAERLFREIYGDTPRELRVRLAFPNLDRVWEYNYECYKKGGMVAKAGGTEETGLRWIYYRDPDTGDLLIKNGVAVDVDGEALIRDGVNPDIPVYTYKNKRNQTVPVMLEPYGRLRVVIPELRVPAFLLFVTKSIYDINSITDELLGIEWMATQMGKTIANVPMVLFRRPDEIPTPINGKRVRTEKWLCHIKADSSWSGATFKALEQMAYPEHSIVDGEATLIKIPAQSSLRSVEGYAVTEQPLERLGAQETDDAASPASHPPPLVEKNISADPTTAFWTYARANGVDKDTAQAIIRESGGNFTKARQALMRQYTLPEEA